MKLNSNFIVHESDGEYYVVSTGGGSFNGIVKNNSTAGFICSCLTEETTVEAIVEKMLGIYDAERDIIERDVKMVIGKLREIGAIDE